MSAGASVLDPGDPRARYRREEPFHALVDSFRALIYRATYTPSELREALMLAVIMETERSPGSIEWAPTQRQQDGAIGLGLLERGIVTPRDLLTKEARSELDEVLAIPEAPR